MPSYAVPQCQQIKKNGSRCGSPALRNQKFCYFHDRCRPMLENGSKSARFPSPPFFLPLFRDANSIQIALGKICEHLLNRRLDPKKAGVLIYAAQMASTNLGRVPRNENGKKGPRRSPAD